MTIGFLQIDLLIRDAHSLKDKRSILLRLKNQLRSKLNIAIAEIGLNDQMRRAVLGTQPLVTNRISSSKL